MSATDYNNAVRFDLLQDLITGMNYYFTSESEIFAKDGIVRKMFKRYLPFLIRDFILSHPQFLEEDVEVTQFHRLMFDDPLAKFVTRLIILRGVSMTQARVFFVITQPDMYDFLATQIRMYQSTLRPETPFGRISTEPQIGVVNMEEAAVAAGTLADSFPF